MSRVRLPIPLKKLLEEPAPAQLDPQRREQWQSIQRERRARKLRRRSIVGSTLVAALALVVYVAHPMLAPRGQGERAGAPATTLPTLALVDGAPLIQRVEPVGAERVLDLNDGSRVTVAPDARLEVLQTSPTRAEFALRRGKVRFEIRPHGPRVWRVDCGTVSIEVLGTAFDVERQDGGVSVTVLRGAVLVRGATVPDAVQRLERGQSLSVPSKTREARDSDDPADHADSELGDAHEANSAAPKTDDDETTKHPSEPDGSRNGVQRARRGAGEAAQAGTSLAERAARRSERAERSRGARASGSEREDEKPETASQVISRLLREADAARMSGRPSEALAPLTEIARRYPRDPEAALAAFALARLRLDVLDQPGDAVIDLERALSLRLPEPLAEDAHARLVEALARAGARSEACVAAADYRVRYPAGSRKGRVERFCGEQSSGP